MADSASADSASADAQSTATGKSLFIMVGDISADRHMGRVLPILKKLQPQLKIWGAGGPAMEAAGVEILHNCEEFSIVGVIEVLGRARFFLKLKDQMLDEIAARKPDAVMLVDSGGFNLRLAAGIKKRFPTLPILYFICPQVWASREWRINTIKQTISKALVIFPFEEKLYRDRGVPAKFVGHPLLTVMPDKSTLPSREEFCAQHKLDPANPIIAIFAGSRRGEVKAFGALLMLAVQGLHDQYPNMQFVFSVADEKLGKRIEECMKKAKLEKLLGSRLYLLNAENNWALMNACDLIWAKNGTTTLESALSGKPLIAFYRGIWLSYLLVMVFKRVKRSCLPNLLAGKFLVPELYQLDCRAELLVRYTRDLLDVPGLRRQISEELLGLRAQLGQGDYATNVANEISAVIDRADSCDSNGSSDSTGKADTTAAAAG